MSRRVLWLSLAAVSVVMGTVVAMTRSPFTRDWQRKGDSDIGCGQDTAAQCFNLGVKQEQAGHAGSAAALYSSACRLGEVQACIALGILHQLGRGVPMDLDQARRYFLQSCQVGEQDGCFKLAAMYGGIGPAEPVDPKRAANLFESCCAGGHAGCCFAAGEYYRLGRGVAASVPRSLRFFERGCELEDVMSCLRAGSLHATAETSGAATTQTAALYEKARSLAEHRCANGDGIACWHDGVIFEEGIGVEPNSTKAAELYAKSCGLGAFVACPRQ